MDAGTPKQTLSPYLGGLNTRGTPGVTSSTAELRVSTPVEQFVPSQSLDADLAHAGVIAEKGPSPAGVDHKETQFAGHTEGTKSGQEPEGRPKSEKVDNGTMPLTIFADDYKSVPKSKEGYNAWHDATTGSLSYFQDNGKKPEPWVDNAAVPEPFFAGDHKFVPKPKQEYNASHDPVTGTLNYFQDQGVKPKLSIDSAMPPAFFADDYKSVPKPKEEYNAWHDATTGSLNYFQDK